MKQSEPIKIIVDDRENAVIDYFKDYKFPQNIKYIVSRINVGDYSVLYKNNIIMCIERKTWKDLSASLRDGRKNNINRMISLRDKTKCNLFYLIEGNPIHKPTTKFCRIPYKNLRSHLDHLMFRDNIHIIHSKNQKNTVERICELIKNYLSIDPSPLLKFENTKLITDEKKTEDKGEILLKKKEKISDDETLLKIWCCIPGINEKTAKLFIDLGYKISDLILGKIDKDTIKNIKYSNNCIIGKRSEKIYNCSQIKKTNYKYFINMMSNVKGITKKTAGIIIDKICFKSFIMGNIDIDELASIKKTSKTSVGGKASSELLKFFST